MKYIKKTFKLFLFFLLLLVCLPLLLHIPTWWDRHFYKNLLIETVDRFTEFKLNIAEFHLSVYPSLEILLENVHLQTKKENIPLLQLEKLHVSIFFIPVIAGGKLDVEDISLTNGFIDVPELLKTIPKSKEKEKKEGESDPQKIINLLNTRLRVRQIGWQNWEIRLRGLHPTLLHNPMIEKLHISYESFSEISILLKILYGTSNLQLDGNLGISPEKLELSELFYKLNLECKDISVSDYRNYLANVRGLYFENSKLNLKLNSQKNQGDLTLNNNINLHLSHIAYRNEKGEFKQIPYVSILGGISYPLLSKKIGIQNLQIAVPGYIHLGLNSEIDFAYKPVIQANLISKYVYLSSILDLVSAFSNSNKEEKVKKENTTEAKTEPIQIYLDLKYNIQHLNWSEYNFYNLYLQTIMKDTAIQYRAGILGLAEGFVHINGEVGLVNGVSMQANVEAEKINMEKLTVSLLKKKMLEGTLSTYIKLQTNDREGEKDFIKNLTVAGNTKLLNGVLLDRADILYPIRFLNKIIPKDEQLNTNISRFDTIDLDYSVKNSKFKITNLQMKGKVFNTTGSATIGLENPSEDIQANLVVSTSIAGAGLKIPMNYTKSSYVPFSIDKVWMGSVYAGMIMGGPMGAMIGSAISEKAGSAIKTISETTMDELNDKKKLFTND